MSRASLRPGGRVGGLLALALALLGCDALPAPPGKPTEADRFVAAKDVVDFEPLYARHCSGCHGADGTFGPARPLHDPIYLALVPRPTLERTIRRGIAGTPMPAFADSEGGPLTDDQIQALMDGLVSRWGGEAPATLPAYAMPDVGSVERGRDAFRTFCARCHGDEGRGGPHGGSIVDAAYLRLVSDQGLRTSVIVGRPDLDMPDWRNDVQGRPMSERQVTDVVAWLVAQRPRLPGGPDSERSP